MVKYVVTGATGGLGSQVLKHLLRLVPASDIIVSLYNPQGASPELQASGVAIRRGDYEDAASLDAAFAGGDRLLLVSYPSLSPERAAHHARAIAAARRAGIAHVFYTSLAFRGGSAAVVMRAHLETEACLRASGIAWTSVREGIYNESWPLWLGFWDTAGAADAVVVPHGDGGVAWASTADLGEATAKILVAARGYENRVVYLTGTQLRSLRDVAARVSALTGRSLRVDVRGVDEYVRAHAHLAGIRGTERFLRQWATSYERLADGELATVDPLLRELLGREPKPLEETLQADLNAGGSGGVLDKYAIN